MTTTARRIYVACLASYNNGVLHGVWIDTENMSAEDIENEVREKVLITSEFPNVEVEWPEDSGTFVAASEEWAIHDHEGFPSGLVGEYTSFSEIADLEEKLGELDSDEEIEAFMIYVNEVTGDNMKDVTVDRFRGAYRGYWDNPKDFAEEWAVETGLISADHPMFSYIDWEYYWNGDLRHSGFYEEQGHIFLND